MSLPKKYNFVPEHQLNIDSSEQSDYTVTINKMSMLYFQTFVVKMFELKGKVIRLYADVANKSIAWTEVTSGKDISALENVRMIKVAQLKGIDQGFAVLSVRRILKQLGITKEMLPFKNIKVTTYKDSLIEGDLNVLDLRPYIKL